MSTYAGLLEKFNRKKETIKYAEKGKAATADAGWKGYFSSLISDINAGKDIFK